MLKKIAWLIDILLIPFIIPSALILKIVRKKGLHYFPITKKILLNVGVLPVLDHYYEPLFNEKHLTKPLSQDRKLPGMDFNVDIQLQVLSQLNFSSELNDVKEAYINDTTFSFKNGSFEHGDAEFLYNMIRLKKPKRMIEIGSGQSTKIAQLAIKKNQLENASITCEHICIEPYEMPWLESINVDVIRKKVEDIDLSFFKKLEANDLLFIDSSHVIRPQGDVLFEYLELLPTLNSGVIVHIHDIFSPKDYLHSWIINEIRLWNEQYLLEAFLTSNQEWEIIGAVNYLIHNHYDAVKDKLPQISYDIEPGSFYILKK